MVITVMASLWLVIPSNVENQSGGVVSDHIEELAVKVDLEEGIIVLSALTAAFSPFFSADIKVKEAPQRSLLHLLLDLGLGGLSPVDDELRELLERGEVKVSASVDATEICGGRVESGLHAHRREDVVELDRRAVAEQRQLEVDVDGMQGAH